MGATEIGPWGFECTRQSGLHINEALFLVKIEDVDTANLLLSLDGTARRQC